MEKQKLKKLIEVAAGRLKADLVIKNCKVVNVFSNEILAGNLAISEGTIIGMGDYEGTEEIDALGHYILPGLIDSHVHIESSMGSPLQFARAVLPRGTTTVIADCHEIANVKGLAGIEYMLKASENIPLDVYMMLPSCVPATPFETSGATLEAKDLEQLIDHERVLGLGELMNYEAVVVGDDQIVDKIALTQSKDKLMDGHGPIIKEKHLNAYSLVGVKTDHECVNTQEAMERLRNGMYVAVREGSAAKNLLDLMGAVSPVTERRFTFCTDDRHPRDILTEGHIDNNIRLAIQSGMDVFSAIRMATLNTAECYGLKNLGALAPGYRADFIWVDNLQDFNVIKTFKNGCEIKPGWEKEIEEDTTLLASVTNSINIKALEREDLKIHLTAEEAHIIKINPHSLVTEHVIKKVSRDPEGYFIYDESVDILPLYVIERHHGTGNIGKGLIQGYGLKNGAIASTIAHDSHNLIVVGDSLENVKLAVDKIIEMGGGLAVVIDGEVREALPLDIGGIMSSDDLEEVSQKHDALNALAVEVLKVSPEVNAFMTLAFMALPVIPEIKITDKGLFDVMTFQPIELSNDSKFEKNL